MKDKIEHLRIELDYVFKTNNSSNAILIEICLNELQNEFHEKIKHLDRKNFQPIKSAVSIAYLTYNLFMQFNENCTFEDYLKTCIKYVTDDIMVQPDMLIDNNRELILHNLLTKGYLATIKLKYKLKFEKNVIKSDLLYNLYSVIGCAIVSYIVAYMISYEDELMFHESDGLTFHEMIRIYANELFEK